ncbi:hypothetical protein FAI40_05005 [Acetobacteraceae bacterium]|nr:hypothetical protein FAI40_05005 [Acetobacteraceae bacterium]
MKTDTRCSLRGTKGFAFYLKALLCCGSAMCFTGRSEAMIVSAGGQIISGNARDSADSSGHSIRDFFREKENQRDGKKWVRNSKGEWVRSEYVHVLGQRTEDPAEEVSGIKADYLNKSYDLGPLGEMQSQKTPFSMMTTTHDVIENQQLRDMTQATQYDPSVRWVQNDMGSSHLVDRGYTSSSLNNSRVDGLNASIQGSYTTEAFDHVSVLNGMAGALYGSEDPAGMLNMVLKRPTENPFFNFNFAYDSNGSPLESLDTSFGKGPVKVRFNYMNQTGQLYTSNSDQWRNLYAGDIDIQLTKHTKLELDASQYNSDLHGLPGQFDWDTLKVGKDGQGIPGAWMGMPPAFDASKAGYGQQNSYAAQSNALGVMKLKHEFSRHLRLDLGGLFQSGTRRTAWATDYICEGKSDTHNGCYLPGVNTADGGFDPNYISQNVAYNARGNVNDLTISNRAYLNGEFKIGPIVHHFNVGSNGYSDTGYSPYGGNSDDKSASTWPYGKNNNVTYPWDQPYNVPGSPQIIMKPAGFRKSNFTQQQDIMFGDNFDIGRQLTVMTELSWTWIHTQSFNTGGMGGMSMYKKGGGSLPETVQSAQVNGAFEPSVALTWHPTNRFSAYFNWGQDTTSAGFAPKDGVSNPNQNLGFLSSTQYEGGMKYLYRDRFLVVLDGFGMSRPYVYQAPYSQAMVKNGKQNDSGVEFQVSGALTREISMFGGVTWINPILRNTGSAETSGKYIVGIPKWNADFLMDWHPSFLHGWSFNTNVHYSGRRAGDIWNHSYSPEYTTLDLGVRYQTRLADHLVVLRGNVDNVTKTNYWSEISPSSSAGAGNPKANYGSPTNSGMLGAPQTWHITASVYF